MAKLEGTYGWSPKTMAQINARRESRGQDPYIDRRMREDEGYRSEYTTAGEDYANRQAGIQQRQRGRDMQQTRDPFAKRVQGGGGEMQKREQARQDLGRMNVDYVKMRQAGGDMSWEDFKKMWQSQKVSAPPQGMTRFA
jgi:hypothetical protein